MVENVSLIDSENREYLLFDELYIRLPEKVDWRVINDYGIGVMFSLFEKNVRRPASFIMVGDMSDPPDEPDTSALTGLLTSL